MKCGICSQKAVIHLKYFDRKLCKEHFNKLTEDRIRKSISKNKLVDKNDRIAVAVSGGKDSITMLYSMANFSEKFPIELIGVTIDEGVKGYRDKAIKIAEKNYKKLGIEYKILSFKKQFSKTMDEIVKKNKKIPCSYCGVFRRRLLNQAAIELDADKIATGHNLDDEVQSILMNYLRGDFVRLIKTGVKTATKEGFVPRIKPLREILEKEITLYTNLNNFEIYKSKCPYRNEAFRNEIRDTLNRWEEKYPGTKFSILKGAGNLTIILSPLFKEAELFECGICGELSPTIVCKVCQFVEEVKDVA